MVLSCASSTRVRRCRPPFAAAKSITAFCAVQANAAAPGMGSALVVTAIDEATTINIAMRTARCALRLIGDIESVIRALSHASQGPPWRDRKIVKFQRPFEAICFRHLPL